MPDNKAPHSKVEKSESSKQDYILVQKALEGNEKAYQKLVDKYNRAMYFHILKMVRNQDIIEDLIQEVFMKAFDNLSSYNSDFAFSTWLYRIATNHSIDYLRKKKLQTYSIDQPVDGKDGEMQVELPDNESETDDYIIRKQRHGIIHEAIDSLPDKYKQVIEMRHMEEKSYQEISDLLDLPLGTIKAHLFRARELLNKYLKDKRQTF